jgi:hypothetical protein
MFFYLISSVCWISEVVCRIALSLSEINDDNTHIIAAFALCSINIWREKGVHKSFTDLGKFDLPLHLYIDVVNDLLGSLGLPDAIAPKYDEVRLISQLVHLDIGH